MRQSALAVFAGFDDHLRAERTQSDHTRSAYRRDVIQFFNYLTGDFAGRIPCRFEGADDLEIDVAAVTAEDVRGYLACLDFQSGELLWRDRKAPKGSLALADGRLYLRTEDGTILLIEPNRERLVERGRFDQPDRTRSPAWSHPVIANGRLYVRDQETLFCYNVKDPSQD